jgi:hypothetical protein
MLSLGVTECEERRYISQGSEKQSFEGTGTFQGSGQYLAG